MIDQYRQAFQEEARELLAELESSLLALDQKRDDPEVVGRAFRALHTIKGSGAMFGFDDIAAFAHNLEHAFDKLRNGQLAATNKTGFFREAGHFEYLVSRALPDLARRRGVNRTLLAWSAGCSTGEEPYTLAVVLSEYLRQCPGLKFNVLATDICTEVLDKAAMGISKSDALRPVPRELLRRYFMRSRNPASDLFRVVPEIRELIAFRRLNLMDSDFGLPATPEIVFCRNVIIYFDRATQIRLLEKLIRHLAPGGYFFAGHSESLQGMDLPLVPVASAVYRKPG